ncbi:MAG: YfdX family protein [Deltaproteobacteria bacterium]|nr:YfdX family protein [Deltaproteobacteria bacterium]
MKKVMIVFTMVVMLLTAVTPAVWAETSAQVSSQAVKNAKVAACDQQTAVIKEAVDALLLTHQVLADLDKKDSDLAVKDLEKAIGKLEVVLADKKAPAMLPIDSSVVAVEYLGDLKSIRENLALVRKYLKDGEIQAARRLLDKLRSEIDVVTVSLPLISYPQALKLAARYLHEEKVDEARDILEMALNTLVRDEIIIPVPLLKAEALVEEARKVAKKDKEQALKHLDAARNELKLAEALGYASSSDTTYKMLDDAVSSVEKEIKGKNRAEKLFASLKEKLKEFKAKAIKTFSGVKGDK